MNRVCLIGRTTADIEVKQTNSGKAVCTFNLAVRRGKEDTDFIDCVAWETAAQLLSRYVSKGEKVGITGRLQVRQWEKDGKKYKAVEVIVDDIDLIAEKKEQKAEEQYTPLSNDQELPF